MITAVAERIEQLKALDIERAIVQAREKQSEREEHAWDEWEEMMNEQVLTLVEQVITHSLCDEKKIRLIYSLMSLYRFDFELDDCKEFIPC